MPFHDRKLIRMAMGVHTFDVPAVDLIVELKSDHLLRDLRRKKHRPEGDMKTFSAI